MCPIASAASASDPNAVRAAAAAEAKNAVSAVSGSRSALAAPARAPSAEWRTPRAPANFNLGNDWIRGLALVKHADGLYLGLSRALPSQFTLQFVGQESASGDGSEPSMASRGRYWCARPQPGLI